MFGLRTKRTTRDRRMGLVFQWRLPVGNHMSFISAIALVALLSIGLAATVRVRVGGAAPRHPERRGSLIVVPQGPEWQALLTMAQEAGPFPVREDPSKDSAVAALVREASSAANVPGYRYLPSFQPIPLAAPDSAQLAGEKVVPGDLPRLPDPEPPPAAAVPGAALRPVVLAGNGLRAVAPAGAPPAGTLQGNRYLLAYDSAGRIHRVTTVFSPQEAPGGNPAVEAWLRQVTIEGGDNTGGWVAVEISGGS